LLTELASVNGHGDMTVRLAGVFLSLLLLLPNAAFAASNFACSLDGHCNCGGVDDCRDMRKSGMCSTALTCKIIYGVLTCACTAAIAAGNSSRIPTPPNKLKQP
jgi:hypothetical protein